MQCMDRWMDGCSACVNGWVQWIDRCNAWMDAMHPWVDGWVVDG